MSAMCSNMQFLIQNQHMISKFSSQTSVTLTKSFISGGCEGCRPVTVGGVVALSMLHLRLFHIAGAAGREKLVLLSRGAE